ncbi:hypothetical protein L195_g048731 [Trifolium pratense]|uniref:Uncharacterized protein n=1 Tax=Trifolium pratense TaxID=57577 RepID=A0A2K3JM35_TRIPR|nr:hypothetical protein L195_g048731 [Trifolium pratense]
MALSKLLVLGLLLLVCISKISSDHEIEMEEDDELQLPDDKLLIVRDGNRRLMSDIGKPR